MNTSGQPGLVGKLIGFMIMAVVLVLGLMFSVVLLAGMLVIGLGAFGYFWWKTRELRKKMKEQAAAQAFRDGTIIEGEAVIVEDGTQARESLRIVAAQEREPSRCRLDHESPPNVM